MANVIGLDLGGTNIKTARINNQGKILDHFEIPTKGSNGQKHVLNNIILAIDKVKKGSISGIGIGSPGPMDYKKGIILSPVNLPFKNLKLREIIQKKFRVKTFLDNDANCFALAEAVFGGGKKFETVCGITLGTGFGGGITIKKRIFHGRNNATEFGHMTIDYKGKKAKSGNDGSVEEYCAARGITNFFDGKTDTKTISKLAKKGNKKAINAYKEMGKYIGVALANLTYAFDPDIIIIGGKISNSWNLFSKDMNEEIKKRYFEKPCPIVKSKLKEPGILGAAALVLEK